MKVNKLILKLNFNKLYEGCITLSFITMLLCTRGMLLGNKYPILALYAGIICILLTIKNKFAYKLSVLFMIIIFVLYCYIQGIFLNQEKNLINNVFIFWIIEIIATYFVFMNKSIERKICRIIIIIMLFFTLSYIISFILSLILNWKSIMLGSFDYNYFYSAPIFFPMTIAYGNGQIGDFVIYRLLGIARESGIMQGFFIWGFYKVGDYFENKDMKKILLGIGVFICFSTTGIIIFLCTLIIRNLFNTNKKFFSLQNILILLIIISCILLLMGNNTFSLANKLSVSFVDRNLAINYGISNFIEHPLVGVGFLKPSLYNYIQTDICLIASIGQIGIVGGALFILIYVVSTFHSINKKKFLLANAGFLLTALVAQPIFYSPLMYIFLFSQYD